jgi:hypothetical protein
MTNFLSVHSRDGSKICLPYPSQKDIQKYFVKDSIPNRPPQFENANEKLRFTLPFTPKTNRRGNRGRFIEGLLGDALFIQACLRWFNRWEMPHTQGENEKEAFQWTALSLQLQPRDRFGKDCMTSVALDAAALEDRLFQPESLFERPSGQRQKPAMTAADRETKRLGQRVRTRRTSQRLLKATAERRTEATRPREEMTPKWNIETARGR